MNMILYRYSTRLFFSCFCVAVVPSSICIVYFSSQTESFGAFVKLDGYRKHGLVHCSQMASYRVEDVTDVCKTGDTVFVKVICVTAG